MGIVHKEKRRHYREKMLAEVSYKDQKNQTYGGCITKDISESGVCIQTREFFAVGTILDLQFNLPLSKTVFYIQGKIVRINKMAYNDRWEIGVEVLSNLEYISLVKGYITNKNPKLFPSK